MTNDTPRGLAAIDPWKVLDAATRGEEWVTFGELKRAREQLASEVDALRERLRAVEGDARRWRHVKDVMTHSYGDGNTEPVEYCLHLEWQQGSWIRDGSNGGRGRPDTFPGWDFIVDEMIGQQERELAELEGDAAIDAVQGRGE